MSSWLQSQRLLTVLLFQKIDHLPLGWLQQGDDSEVGLMSSKVRTHNLGGLQ